MSHLWCFVGACGCLVLLMLDVCGLRLVVLLMWAGEAGVGWGRCNGRGKGSEVRVWARCRALNVSRTAACGRVDAGRRSTERGGRREERVGALRDTDDTEWAERERE